MTIDTAVFVVAGMGTRFLPATKTIPKEMFPVLDTPLVHYAVKDALAAGVTNLVFITSKSKKALEDFYDEDPLLEQELFEAKKTHLLEVLKSVIPPNVQISFVRQTQPKGVAHALWCAREILKNKTFLMLYPDDYIINEKTSCFQLVDAWKLTKKSIIGVQPVPHDQCHLYGVMDIAHDLGNNLFSVNKIVEKPKQNPPSNLVAIGRYVLEPQLFNEILKLSNSADKEWPMMDAWSALCTKQEVAAQLIEGLRFDCGSKLGYLKANIYTGLQDSETKTELQAWLKTLSF